MRNERNIFFSAKRKTARARAKARERERERERKREREGERGRTRKNENGSACSFDGFLQVSKSANLLSLEHDK